MNLYAGEFSNLSTLRQTTLSIAHGPITTNFDHPVDALLGVQQKSPNHKCDQNLSN